MGPNDTFEPPPWFLKEIIVIAVAPSRPPNKASVRFDVSKEAAEHNMAVLLQEVHYDFQRFLETQAESTLAFGSGFRPIEELRPLLRTHPGFKELAYIHVTGAVSIRTSDH